MGKIQDYILVTCFDVIGARLAFRILSKIPPNSQVVVVSHLRTYIVVGILFFGQHERLHAAL